MRDRRPSAGNENRDRQSVQRARPGHSRGDRGATARVPPGADHADDAGTGTCSSEELAAAAGVNSAKLRKDLSYLGSYGTRGVGYDVDYLRYQIAREIGLTQDWPVVIVGIGNLGHALANYSGFRSRGFRVVALLDADPERHREIVAGVDVRPFDDLEQIVGEHGVAIGVIATPAAAAQDVADRMVAAGITSILNFAPAVLVVPDGVDVRKVDLSIELQILAYHEQRKAQSAARRRRPHERPGRRHLPPRRPGRGARAASPSTPTVRPSCSRDVAAGEHVIEAAVVATCNRLEVYADVDRFHGSVEELSGLLVERAGRADRGRCSPHLYVHYDDGAVSHLFHVAAGPRLDGRRREPDPRPGARGAAPAARRPAPSARRSTRCSSRPCGSASACTPRPTSTAPRRPSVGAALDRADRRDGSPAVACVVVGAGSMAAPGRRHARAPRAPPTSSSSTAPPTAPAASPPSTASRAAALAELAAEVAAADVVVACTGATGVLVDADDGPARARRPARWPWSTSPCRTTSTRPSPTSPASP